MTLTIMILFAIGLIIWSQTQKAPTGELTSAGKTASGFGKTMLWIILGGVVILIVGGFLFAIATNAIKANQATQQQSNNVAP